MKLLLEIIGFSVDVVMTSFGASLKEERQKTGLGIRIAS
jgi:hypothetical protein